MFLAMNTELWLFEPRGENFGKALAFILARTEGLILEGEGQGHLGWSAEILTRMAPREGLELSAIG